VSETAIHRFVLEARAGKNPRVIARMPSGWAVLGESQFLRGYSLLLPDPVVPHLNAMEPAHRTQFLHDMAHLGEAVLAVTGAVRINYEMLGNVEPALHAHLFPRYGDGEVAELRTRPVWFYDWTAGEQFDAKRHAELMGAIAAALRANT
jgi:diadenosine tetraphosphate (Ap4A) HIT family hydrolase